MKTDPRPTRRQFVHGLAAALVPAVVGSLEQKQASDIGAFEPSLLPPGVRSRFMQDINGIRVHVLEAGFELRDRPLVVLLHGFPELAYSWRKIMPSLASAGYHVVAPDVRGYGRTDGTNVAYDDDVAPFRIFNKVLDTVALVFALGYRSAHVVGHDFGSPVAAWCALIRPDIFRSVVLMSAPFGGTPTLGGARSSRASIVPELARQDPPRKHYQWYYSTPEANDNMWHAPQGVHDFLRAYFHMKSGDWKPNKPFRLESWTGAEIAKLPRYYVMDLNQGMAETVAPEMPSKEEIAACEWLPDDELRVFSAEYERTGFQGGLNGYRSTTTGVDSDLRVFAGRTIDPPSLFIAGKADWGVYQSPGAVERMEREACTDMRGVHLVEGAGHWVQQERREEVSRLLLEFLREVA